MLALYFIKMSIKQSSTKHQHYETDQFKDGEKST